MLSSTNVAKKSKTDWASLVGCVGVSILDPLAGCSLLLRSFWMNQKQASCRLATDQSGESLLILSMAHGVVALPSSHLLGISNGYGDGRLT